MKPVPVFSTLEEALSNRCGEGSRVIKKEPVGGGCISAASLLSLSNGATLFLKENTASQFPLFEAEAEGLLALREIECNIGVPEPVALVKSERAMIVMEAICPGRKEPHFWELFGEQLALLHKNSRDCRFYGFSSDNFIGDTEQINRESESWISFFREFRLGFQINLARKRGLADRSMVKRCERVMETLDNLLPEPDAPSLLHGDLWSGNYMVGPKGEPYIVDPAVYRGHREADLAMTELFGGFSAPFYTVYNETFPLEAGYRERRDLYNLYHMLNHLNIFGSGYAGSVNSILNHYV